MNQEFQSFLNEQSLVNGFPENLPTDNNLTPDELAEVINNQSIPDNDPLTGEPWNASNENPAETNDNEETTIDEETGEVTTISKAKPMPKLTPAETGYKAIVITLADDEEETKAEIEKRALTNPALAEALKNGKKTWQGFFRFWHNQTCDAHKRFNIGSGNALVVHREKVWDLAEEYFTNDGIRDINPATSTKQKASKPKAEKKPKAEPKPKTEKKTKVVPITPQMGCLFGDDDFK